jgi:ABC-type nitrate/sulfonate/bicarbonate transport system substrate-binding protein
LPALLAMMLLALATSLARAAASSSAAAAAPSAPWLGAGWLVSLPEEELQLQQADRGQYSL